MTSILRVSTGVCVYGTKSAHFVSSQKWKHNLKSKNDIYRGLALSYAFSRNNILDNMDLFHDDVQDKLLMLEFHIAK